MDLQEHLDAEVWARIMGRFVDILAEEVRRFGGTVDKFTGDGIMALFGAPVAQEDHARRACHAAWHITRAIAAYAEELRRDQDVDLQVRLGLNSGEVVVGRVGDGVTLDPTALGHTVGLAQRMEAMAEPGRAYLTEHTARLVEGWFGLEDLGPKTVKGVAASAGRLRVGQAGRRRRSPGRRPRWVPRGWSVGSGSWLRWRTLSPGRRRPRQVVGVVGEAGVGKSRLCEEFAARRPPGASRCGGRRASPTAGRFRCCPSWRCCGTTSASPTPTPLRTLATRSRPACSPSTPLSTRFSR